MYLSIGMKKGPPRFITLDLPWRTLDGMEPWSTNQPFQRNFPCWEEVTGDSMADQIETIVTGSRKGFFFQFQLNKRNRKLVVNYRILFSCGELVETEKVEKLLLSKEKEENSKNEKLRRT